ncbi:hypothetical protein [Pararhodonellum marinum]|uniref:hypothetical protein n=1 Tax=Pararhodonellum marinum TaxID=2755358 RepID=UPI0018902CCE|nr:hypothetical protein [Pararhodonellum marinum]
MDWTVANSKADANHNPIIVLNKNERKDLAKGKVKAGNKVQLSAKETFVPDGHQLRYK